MYFCIVKGCQSKCLLIDVSLPMKIILILSYDVASGSEIKPCNKNDKPLVVYRFSGIVT